MVSQEGVLRIYSVSNKSKKEGKDQESIQSSTTPEQGHHMGM